MHFSSLCAFSCAIALATSRSVMQRGANKPIFAHYMIGDIQEAHTRQDIQDAQSLGIDAFALNYDQFAYWSNSTMEFLFNHADELGFKLFFSFDLAAGHINKPSDFIQYLQKYTTRASYYAYNGKALVSTFGGESVTDQEWASFKNNFNVLVIPGFYQTTPSTTFFNGRGSLDGIFNWNAFPNPRLGKVLVSSTDDATYCNAAHSAKKLCIMGIMPLQFKQLDSNQNWYIRGEGNLEERLIQALQLQPDMIELQTWNDAGESHYMGNIWSESLQSDSGKLIQGYTNDYSHTGYWQILQAFIKAWKRGDTGITGMIPTNGKRIQGTLWHHTLLVDGTCGLSSSLGKPRDFNNAEDAVSGVILVASGENNLVAVVNGGSGGTQLGRLNLVPGYNKFKFDVPLAGNVSVEVWDGSTMIGGGYSPIAVAGSSAICNYNFQVVGFP